MSGRNVYKYVWTEAEFTWETSVLRASSRADRFAVGTEDSFEFVTPENETSHNRLQGKVRFLRTLHDKLFWYVSYDALRDDPSNINRNLVGSGGVGNTWYDGEKVLFRTTYGLTYTDEDLDLEGQRDFGGYRLFSRLEAEVSENASVESELTFDANVIAKNDFRMDSFNGITVAVSHRIALKTSLRLFYRNRPALEEVKLRDPDLGTVIGELRVTKEKLDATVTTSLVVAF